MLHNQVANRHDEKALISISKNAREQLEQTLLADQLENESHPEESST
jgi:hypothetical protein